MYKSITGALAIAAVATVPAIAQTATQNQPGQQPQAQGSQTQGSQTPEQQMQSRIASQEQVREALNTSGFEEVSFVDAAYLVTATAPSGETVMMVVNPSGMMSGILGNEPTSTSSTTGQGGSSSGSASGSMPQNQSGSGQSGSEETTK